MNEFTNSLYNTLFIYKKKELIKKYFRCYKLQIEQFRRVKLKWEWYHIRLFDTDILLKTYTFIHTYKIKAYEHICFDKNVSAHVPSLSHLCP